MTVRQAFDLGAMWYHDRLSVDWRPGTLQEAHAAFAAVGLTSEFWRS